MAKLNSTFLKYFTVFLFHHTQSERGRVRNFTGFFFHFLFYELFVLFFIFFHKNCVLFSFIQNLHKFSPVCCPSKKQKKKKILKRITLARKYLCLHLLIMCVCVCESMLWFTTIHKQTNRLCFTAIKFTTTYIHSRSKCTQCLVTGLHRY